MLNEASFSPKKRTETTTDVVILGGGVIGCAIAYFLRTMQIEVTLLERGAIGSQASSAAAGLLAPLGPLSGPGPFADLLLTGFSRLIHLIPEIETVSGIRVGYEQTGALRAVFHPKRTAHLQKRFTRWQPLGLQLTWLSGEEARQREPLLHHDVCAAVYAPEEAQLQAPHLVQAFALAAHRLGATIIPHQEVVGLLTHGTSVTGVVTAQGETIACKWVILASGAWAAQCSAWLQVSLPIRPLHGQLLTMVQPPQPLRHLVFGEAAYLAPRGNILLVGATKEEMGFDVSVTNEGTSWLTTTAQRLVPVLAESRVEAAWAGLRPKTPDSHPILGNLPLWDHVLVAAGHNSVGVMLSAITGQCLAEMVATGHTPSLVEPFSATRFLSREKEFLR